MILKGNIHLLFILVVGILTSSCKSGSFVKRKYLNGNYISYSGRSTEPKINESKVLNVIPATTQCVNKAEYKNDVVYTTIYDNKYIELSTSNSENIRIINQNSFSKKLKEANPKNTRYYKPKPFHIPIFDFSYLSDDDPIAKKMRVLFYISLGIIVIGLPILYLLGLFSSINGFILLMIFAIGCIAVVILAIVNFILNIIRWKRYKK